MSVPEQLAAPFPHEAIHWRAQQVYERDGSYSALALAYLDARDVMNRLDGVVGAYRWQDDYEETPKGRVICRLSLNIGGDWITKSDAAGDTAVEGEKGGVSDALKRAGVKWGIGRYLYSLGNTYAPCEAFKGNDGKLRFKKWKPEAQSIFRDRLNGVAPEPNRETGRKLAGKWTSITGLEKAIKTFARQMAECGDWADWQALRSQQEFVGLLEQAERDHPDWFFGWHGMPDEFVPLKARVEQLETDLAEAKVATLQAG